METYDKCRNGDETRAETFQVVFILADEWWQAKVFFWSLMIEGLTDGPLGRQRPMSARHQRPEYAQDPDGRPLQTLLRWA